MPCADRRSWPLIASDPDPWVLWLCITIFLYVFIKNPLLKKIISSKIRVDIRAFSCYNNLRKRENKDSPWRQQVSNKSKREAVPLYYNDSKAQSNARISRSHTH